MPSPLPYHRRGPRTGEPNVSTSSQYGKISRGKSIGPRDRGGARPGCLIRSSSSAERLGMAWYGEDIPFALEEISMKTWFGAVITVGLAVAVGLIVFARQQRAHGQAQQNADEQAQ